MSCNEQDRLLSAPNFHNRLTKAKRSDFFCFESKLEEKCHNTDQWIWISTLTFSRIGLFLGSSITVESVGRGKRLLTMKSALFGSTFLDSHGFHRHANSVLKSPSNGFVEFIK